jgi:hypothetical protein
MLTKVDMGGREREKHIDGLNNAIKSEIHDSEGLQVIEARIWISSKLFGVIFSFGVIRLSLGKWNKCQFLFRNPSQTNDDD